MAIQQGDEFSVKMGGQTNRFRRESDDPNPRFDSERIRVTHLSCSDAPNMTPYTFGTEPEWFVQRGVEAA